MKVFCEYCGGRIRRKSNRVGTKKLTKLKKHTCPHSSGRRNPFFSKL